MKIKNTIIALMGLWLLTGCIEKVATLPDEVSETSGLAYFDGMLWTHNDSKNKPILYRISETTGEVLKRVTITNATATNADWEDLATDEHHLYIGDFGNNINGNRQDLKIYKIKKSDLKSKTKVKAEIINFKYNNQSDFTPKGANNTKFDCEAFIAHKGSLYLFTKNWLYGWTGTTTSLYKLSKAPGNRTAEYQNSFDLNGMVTGASIVMLGGQNANLVLIGYDGIISPKMWYFNDVYEDDFFKAYSSEEPLWDSHHGEQIEGITHDYYNSKGSGSGNKFISSEKQPTFRKKQTLYHQY